MVSNKKRLYVALYPSGVLNNEERKYHWGFLVGPKIENKPPVPGARFHVKNNPDGSWVYQELELRNVQTTTTLLARILIGKIENEALLIQTLRAVPVVQGDANWRCRTWVQQALSDIVGTKGALGTSVVDWNQIETFAREYVGKKAGDGRYRDAALAALPRPTFDLLDNKEVLP